MYERALAGARVCLRVCSCCCCRTKDCKYGIVLFSTVVKIMEAGLSYS